MARSHATGAASLFKPRPPPVIVVLSRVLARAGPLTPHPRLYSIY